MRRGLSFARRSATRYQTLHDWAGSFYFQIRQRSWDLCALRSVPCQRVPAFSAVHPHMPLSDHATPLIFTGVGRKSKLLPSEILETTNCGIIQPASGTCTTDKPSRTSLTTGSTNPAMGFGFFSQAFGCFFTARRAFTVDRKDRNSPQPTFWLPSARGI
jgi:hypothetical protein